MKLIHPLEPFIIAQPFGANANPLYHGDGLKGHPGLDLDGNYGKVIVSAVDSYLYSTINMGASPNKYRAVYTVFDDGDFSYEITYGHVIDCLHPIKTNIKAGDPIARVGNFGEVYAGDHLVTEAEKLAGSTAGRHLHFQVRKCVRVTNMVSGRYYLQDAHGYLKINGFYYEAVDYYAGYNGCIDPIPFFSNIQPPLLTKDLQFSSRDPEVKVLQHYLNTHGFPVITPETDYFGSLTKAAVIKFQTSNGIAPALGNVFSITRAFINSHN